MNGGGIELGIGRRGGFMMGLAAARASSGSAVAVASSSYTRQGWAQEVSVSGDCGGECAGLRRKANFVSLFVSNGQGQQKQLKRRIVVRAGVDDPQKDQSVQLYGQIERSVS